MPNTPDKVNISFDQNPACAEAFRNAKSGDKGTMGFQYTYESGDQTGCILSVEAFVPEGYEVAKDAETHQMNPMSTGGDSMTATAMLVRKKESKRGSGPTVANPPAPQ